MAIIKKNQEVTSDTNWVDKLKAKQSLRGELIGFVERTTELLPGGYSQPLSKAMSTGRLILKKSTSIPRVISLDL